MNIAVTRGAASHTDWLIDLRRIARPILTREHRHRFQTPDNAPNAILPQDIQVVEIRAAVARMPAASTPRAR